jgi:hypothetical protein
MTTGPAHLMILIFNLLALVAVRAYPATRTRIVDDPAGTHSGFDLSNINEQVTNEFLKAWNSSRNGIDKVESVVLIFRKVDGSYFAIALGQTNETNKLRFKWDPAAIAIAHTHPNSIDPQPSGEDMRLAERFGVPIFTMTRLGMYMYDPGTHKITKIQNNLDWLDPAKWVRTSHINQN